MLLLIPSVSYAWRESIYASLDALIKQADYIVVATVSSPEPEIFNDGIEKRKVTFYYNLKGDAPLNKSLNVANQSLDIPTTFNYQKNFCVLFLNKDTQNGFDFIVVGNQHSLLPAGLANDSGYSKGFSRMNGLSVKAAVKNSCKKGSTIRRRPLPLSKPIWRNS